VGPILLRTCPVALAALTPAALQEGQSESDRSSRAWRNLSARGLEKAAERAGLIPTNEQRQAAKTTGADAGPGLRFHDLRHTFAAIGADLGWSDGYLSKVMGHSSVAFTQKQYGHLFDRRSKMRAASASLEARFGQLVESTLESTGGDTRRESVAANGSNVALLHGSATGGD
jgi:Phage integrase family